MLYRFLGLRLTTYKTARSPISCETKAQDGSWALYYDGPADVSTTIESYVALKVLGVDPRAPQMHKALAVIHAAAASSNARVFTKIWLALFGIYPWSGVPSLPPELVYFPLWVPFNSVRFRLLGARNRRAADHRASRKNRCANSASTSARSFVPGSERELHPRDAADGTGCM